MTDDYPVVSQVVVPAPSDYHDCHEHLIPVLPQRKDVGMVARCVCGAYWRVRATLIPGSYNKAKWVRVSDRTAQRLIQRRGDGDPT